MPHVVCDQVTRGLRESEVTVAIRDLSGRREFLRVEKGFLTQDGGKSWLPVGAVYEDKEKGVCLIELPQEAESGTNRLWVRSASLLKGSETPA